MASPPQWLAPLNIQDLILGEPDVVSYPWTEEGVGEPLTLTDDEHSDLLLGHACRPVRELRWGYPLADVTPPSIDGEPPYPTLTTGLGDARVQAAAVPLDGSGVSLRLQGTT